MVQRQHHSLNKQRCFFTCSSRWQIDSFRLIYVNTKATRKCIVCRHKTANKQPELILHYHIKGSLPQGFCQRKVHVHISHLSWDAWVWGTFKWKYRGTVSSRDDFALSSVQILCPLPEVWGREMSWWTFRTVCKPTCRGDETDKRRKQRLPRHNCSGGSSTYSHYLIH